MRARIFAVDPLVARRRLRRVFLSPNPTHSAPLSAIDASAAYDLRYLRQQPHQHAPQLALLRLEHDPGCAVADGQHWRAAVFEVDVRAAS